MGLIFANINDRAYPTFTIPAFASIFF